MRRRLLLLGAMAALAVPANAQAATTVDQIPLDATIFLCDGSAVHLQGQLMITSTWTAMPSGGFVVASQFQPQGVKGVGVTTGIVYIGTGVTRDLFVVSPSGSLIETFVNEFQIQATSGAESYIVREVFHFVFGPDGTLRVVIDKFSSTC
jgi:hypothetical protein